MSRFYRRMEAFSKKPSDFHQTASSKPNTVPFDPATTVVTGSTATVPFDPASTVVAAPARTVQSQIPETFWRAELNQAIFAGSRVRRVVLAQDALTRAEKDVYTFLWNSAPAESEDWRLAEGGYDRIANAVRVTKENARLILRRLTEKNFLALERGADTMQRRPALYRVFSFRQILEKLRSQGRIWIVRSGNGVLFVHPMTVLVAPAATVVVDPAATVVVDPAATVPVEPATVVAGVGSTVPAGQSTTVLAARTVLVKENLEKTERTTTTDVRARLQADLPTFDDDAVEKLWTACRAEVPDVTAEEVAALFRLKLPESRSRLIENPNGFLLRAVARSCTVAAVAAMRRQGRESPAGAPLSFRDDELRGLLEDPNTPLELRHQITQKLQNT